MKILVITSTRPHYEHTVRAANIVIYELLKAIVKISKDSVGLLLVEQYGASQLNSIEKNGLKTLQKNGLEILPRLVLPPVKKIRSKIWRNLIPKLSDRYPEWAHSSIVSREIFDWNADLIFIPWSEWLTFTCHNLNVKKFAYYGNPDPKVLRANIEIRLKSGEINYFKYYLKRITNKWLENRHINAMKKIELLGNVAANDANYYLERGHPNSFYIQNTWYQGYKNSKKLTKMSRTKTVRIIGNVGKVGGTANSLGLEYLGNEVMPALEKILHRYDFEVHIFGSGKALKNSYQAQINPRIVWRGFVNDIDQEMLDGDVFLCVNNATNFKVCHTRYLYAWSLKLPIVAHADTSLSIPEMKHGINALLGKNADEIAKCVKELIDNKSLRNRISESGYKTFQTKFSPEIVAKNILNKISESN